MGRVIRAETPPRGKESDEHRQVLWTVTRLDIDPLVVTAELVAFIDAVELEITVSGVARRRKRFLRDVTARTFANRLRGRLLGRGFADAASVA